MYWTCFPSSQRPPSSFSTRRSPNSPFPLCRPSNYAHLSYINTSFPSPTSEMHVTTLSPTVKVGLGGKGILRIVDIPSNNSISFVCEDRMIRVFKNDSGGGPVHIFQGHVGSGNRKVYLLQLFDGILCSMDAGGNLNTWLGISGVVLETLNVGGSIEMWKLDDTRLGSIVGRQRNCGNLELFQEKETVHS